MAKYRIPGNTTGISDGWAEHRARGSLGGTDFVDGMLTPMHAMADGVVVMVDSNPGGSGGRMITIRHDDGDSTEELHAQSFIVVRGQRVSMGQVIGYSGGSGFGLDRYYGPHIHAHGVHANGVRFDVQPLIDFANPTNPNAGTAGGGGTTPITNTNEEEDAMYAVQWKTGLGPTSNNGAYNDSVLVFGRESVESVSKQQYNEGGAAVISKFAGGATIVNDAEISRLCDFLGVPFDAVRATIAGTAVGGRYWSRQLEIQKAA